MEAQAERLKFEKLLTELSLTLVKIPASDVDAKVEAVLRRIGEIIGIDRTDFVQLIGETGQSAGRIRAPGNTCRCL